MSEETQTFEQDVAGKIVKNVVSDLDIDGRIDTAVAKAVKAMAGEPDRSKVLGNTEEQRGGDVGQIGRDSDSAEEIVRSAGEVRARLAMEIQYKGLSELERSVRSVEGDIRVWKWANYRAVGDRERASQICMESMAAHSPHHTADQIRSAFATMQKDQQRASEFSRVVLGSDGGLAGTAGSSMVPIDLQAPIGLIREIADKIGPRAFQARATGLQVNLTAEATIPAAVVFTGGSQAAQGVAEAEPTYRAVLLSKVESGYITRSARQLMEDVAGAFSLVSNFSNQAGRSMGRFNNIEHISGSNYTDSILTSSIEPLNTESTAGTTVSRAELLALKFELDPEWWQDSVYVMGVTNLQRVSELEEAVGGRPLYPGLLGSVENVTGDHPTGVAKVEGLPVIVVSDAAMGGANSPIICGDLSQGHAALRDDTILAETTTEGNGAFEGHQMQWKFVQRQDGGVFVAHALRKSTAFTA